MHKYHEEFPQQTFMAGNVVTGKNANELYSKWKVYINLEELRKSRLDINKVCFDLDSICNTRKQTGEAIRNFKRF